MHTSSKRAILNGLLAAAVVATVALGSNVTLTNTFVAGTPARAAEVNKNFQDVKAAVDDNHSKIQTLQTTQAAQATSITSLQTTQTTHSSSISTLQSTQTSQGTSISSLNGRVAALETPEAWQNLTLGAGWQNYDPARFQAAQFMKDGMGFVHLRGICNRVSGSSSVIGTLPVGYRPIKEEPFLVLGGAGTTAQVNVSSDGTIVLQFGNTAAIQLSGLTFDTR